MTQMTAQALAQDLIGYVQKASKCECDVLVTTQQSTSIGVQDQRLEDIERSESRTIGLRVIKDKRQAIVSSSNMDPEALRQMAERALLMANEAPQDESLGLAQTEQLASQVDMSALDQLDLTPPNSQQLKELALTMEQTAASFKGVSKVQSSSAGHTHTHIDLCASNGFSASYEKTSTGLSCMAMSGEGTQMARDYDFDSHVHFSDLKAAIDIGQIAAERAIARIGAKRPPTGRFPVLFDERISASLVGHITAAINGSAIVRGTSWLRNHLECQILPSGISLLEMPHRPRLYASKLFDAEGLATQERAIIDDGYLKSWTLDLGTARKLGQISTGNAARGTGSAPSPSLTNLQLINSSQNTPAQSQAALLKDMGTGLFVTSFIGATLNPNTGDYSRGVTGFWVENGELSYPIHEATVASNLHDMLKTVVLANDADPTRSHSVPSLLVDHMTVAGA